MFCFIDNFAIYYGVDELSFNVLSSVNFSKPVHPPQILYYTQNILVAHLQLILLYIAAQSSKHSKIVQGNARK